MINTDGKYARLFLIFFLFLFPFYKGYSQTPGHEYTPLKYSYKPGLKSKKIFLKRLHKNYTPISGNKKITEAFKKYLYDLELAYGKASRGKEFIAEPMVEKYLQQIVDTILKANHIGVKFDVLCTRYAIPNAFNMGDYRLYVNMGLFNHLNNEAHLAFVIAHEMSHKLLNHVEQEFVKHEEIKRDKTVKAELKNIKRAKYNKLDRAVQFVRGYDYDFSRYSRAFESEADSLAFHLLLNTAYDLNEILPLFVNLEHSDEDNTVLDYAAILGNRDHTFHGAWILEAEDKITFGNAKLHDFDEDSLKTHPDMEQRSIRINEYLREKKYSVGNRKKSIFDTQIFDTLKFCADFEELELFRQKKRYSAMVYHSLKLLQKYPGYLFLKNNVLENLKLLSDAIGKHKVQEHIPIESDELPIAYNEFLRIIDRTSRKEFDRLILNYIDNNRGILNSYSETQKIYNELSK